MTVLDRRKIAAAIRDAGQLVGAALAVAGAALLVAVIALGLVLRVRHAG